jgi:hypothetical protein
MGQLFAALKLLAGLGGFFRWLVDTVRAIKAESLRQKADSTHAQNKNDIDAAFAAPVGGVPVDTGAKPSAIPAQTSPVSGGEIGGSRVGQGSPDDNQRPAAGTPNTQI